jgi:PAS domain S-box-containing protein
MKKIIWINQSPFSLPRILIVFLLTSLIIIFLIAQLTGINENTGWKTIHQQAPLLFLVELLPIAFILFLWFVSSNRESEDKNLKKEKEKQELLHTISTTVDKIKAGSYDKENDRTGIDVIDTALREIHDKFKHDTEQEKLRSWGNEGLALFREVMGSHQSIKSMCEELISKLTKYIGAAQGGIFLLNDDQTLELTACYAFERKKYLTKTVEPGVGLVGQCFLERHPIFLTKVPDSYLHITSGLGLANPNCVLIVPLNLKDSTVGVMELAGFKVFEKYQLEFIEKLAEALSQSIISIRTGEETKKLLEKSLSREQEMKDQEERMRQNMEELYVTQEDMRKINLEMEEIFKAIDTLTSTLELDREGKIIKLNDRLLQTLSSSAQDLYGRNFVSLLHKPEETDTYKAAWPEILRGKPSEKVFTILDANKNLKWLRTGFYPLHGKNGTERIICFLTDITEIKNKEVQLDKVNKEMEATRKMLIKILNEIPLKVFLKQYNGKFFVVNDAVSRFHGFKTPEGLIGKSDFDFYDHKVAAEWLEAEHQIIATGRKEYIHEDGGKILSTVKMPFFIDPVNETGLLGFQADVTELMELRKKMEAYEARAVR